ncbi:hypothetical protein V1522DRAFT_411773 [Lipomyces starkeyi]
MDKEAFPYTGGNQNHVPVVVIVDSNHAVSPFAGNGAKHGVNGRLEFVEQFANHILCFTH